MIERRRRQCPRIGDRISNAQDVGLHKFAFEERPRYRLRTSLAALAFFGRRAKLDLQHTWPWPAELAAFERLQHPPSRRRLTRSRRDHYDQPSPRHHTPSESVPSRGLELASATARTSPPGHRRPHELLTEQMTARGLSVPSITPSLNDRG